MNHRQYIKRINYLNYLKFGVRKDQPQEISSNNYISRDHNVMKCSSLIRISSDITPTVLPVKQVYVN
jgi:hypothetical protein